MKSRTPLGWRATRSASVGAGASTAAGASAGTVAARRSSHAIIASVALVRIGAQLVTREIAEPGDFALEMKRDVAGRTVALLGHDQRGAVDQLHVARFPGSVLLDDVTR